MSDIIDTLAMPNDSATVYFPFPKYSETQIKENKRSLDSFVYTWYSKMLFALHEPVLYSYQGKNEIYRFTLLRSFDHPITVRLQKQGDQQKLFSKMTNGAGGYEPGQIIWDTAFDIRTAQLDTLKSLVDKADFWNSPTEVYDDGLDGAEWILEAVNNDKYHWVSRWSPSASRHTNFKTICDYLLNISKAPLGTDRIY